MGRHDPDADRGIAQRSKRWKVVNQSYVVLGFRIKGLRPPGKTPRMDKQGNGMIFG
jgi:hypothetical protein